MSVKIKICGITSLGDALAAVEAGADALGFIFYEPSPRYLTGKIAGEITRSLPPFVAKVGVFVNASRERVKRAIEESRIDTLQFHGEESPEFCRQFELKTIKAFRVQGRESLSALLAYQTEAWLLDSYVPGKPGGTGAQFSWELARDARELGRPIILAGGLTPENVGVAIQQVQPFAVDVSSGVESARGIKDLNKLREFIRVVKAQP